MVNTDPGGGQLPSATRLIKGGNPSVPVELALNIGPEFLHFKAHRISPYLRQPDVGAV